MYLYSHIIPIQYIRRYFHIIINKYKLLYKTNKPDYQDYYKALRIFL